MDRSDGNNKENGGTGNVGRSSNKNLLDKKMQDQLKERRDEQQLFERFRNVAVDRLNQLSLQAERDDNGGQKLTMGEEEKRIMANMNGMGLKEGVAAGLLSFLVLRRGPVYFGRWVRRRQLARQSTYTPTNNGYKLSDPRTFTNATTNNPFQRSANPEFPRSRSLVIRSVWFMFDTVLSLMMAASVSMAYTDTDEIRKQILEMPLVPGRSLTADALCDGMVQELIKVQEEKNSAYERLQKLNKEGAQTPASGFLEGIVQFCENCQRRRYVEKRIRQERGLARKEPVEIPYPGVDRNGPRLVVNSLGEEMVVGNGGNDVDFHEQFGSHDMDWANNFVSDKDRDQSRE